MMKSDNNEKIDQLIELLTSVLAKSSGECSSVTEHVSAHEDLVAALQEHLEEKEKRIQHLETVKLTKDQMDKIVLMKSERKMYQEESKRLQKVEVQLLEDCHQRSLAIQDLKLLNSRLIEENKILLSQLSSFKVSSPGSISDFDGNGPDTCHDETGDNVNNVINGGLVDESSVDIHERAAVASGRQNDDTRSNLKRSWRSALLWRCN